MSTVLVIDTETASFDGGVVDFAAAEIDEDFNVVWSIESLIDPERRIEPGAQGVHGITNDMVRYEPTLAEFMDLHKPFDREDLVLAAHNVPFDLRMLAGHVPAGTGKLCSLKLARLLYPDPGHDHKLQTLKCAFDLNSGTAHRAMGDVITCVSLLKHFSTTFNLSLQQLIALVDKPLSGETVISFGKHKGSKLKDIPKSYAAWMVREMQNLDPDIKQALQTVHSL